MDSYEEAFHHEPEDTPFVGRARELNDLVEAFTDTILTFESPRGDGHSQIKLGVVYGYLNIGKTRFAVEAAKELKIWCQTLDIEIDVLFIELRGLGDPRLVRAKLISSLLPQQQDAAMQQEGREIPQGPRKKWHLFILDGADDFGGNDLQDGFMKLCQELVGEEVNVLLIITTRWKFDFIRIANQVKQICLNPLSFDESKQLLLKIAPNLMRKDLETDRELDIKDIIDHCDGIPNYLALAGADIRDGRRTVTNIAADLRCKNVKRKRNDSGVEADVEDDVDVYTQRARMILGGYVETLAPSLRKGLAKLAFIPGSFTAEAAAHMAGPGPEPSPAQGRAASLGLESPIRSTAIAKRDVLLPLHRRSLVAYETLSRRFAVLSFLRLYLEERYSLLLEPAEMCAVRGRYCGFYARLLQQAAGLLERDNACKSIPIFMAELQNMQKLLQEIIHCPEESYDLFIEVAHQARTLILQFIPNHDAISFYQACLQAAERRKDKYRQARMLTALGRLVRYVDGDMDYAERLYREALELLAPLGDSLDHAMALSMLGFHFFDSAKPKLAISYQEDALEMIDRLEGQLEGDPTVTKELPIAEDDGKGLSPRMQLMRLKSQALEEMACVHGRLNGNSSEAIKCHEESISLQKMLWRDHLNIGQNYYCLALIYHNIGDRNMARTCAEKSLNIIQRLCTQPCPTLIICYDIVATVIFDSGDEADRRDALELIGKAWQVQGRLKTRNILKYCLQFTHAKMIARGGDFTEARRLFSEGFTMAMPILGKHLNTARALQSEGWAALQLADHEGAIPPLLHCLEMRLEALRNMKWNVETAETYETLGDVCAAREGSHSRLLALTFYHHCYRALAAPIKLYRSRGAPAEAEVRGLQDEIMHKMEIVSSCQSDWSPEDVSLMKKTVIYEYNYWPLT